MDFWFGGKAVAILEALESKGRFTSEDVEQIKLFIEGRE